jgi:co-chaperonin GroES (HSP10)
MKPLPTIPIIPNGLRYWVLPDAKEDKTIRVGEVTLSGDNSTDREPPVQGRIMAVGDAEYDEIEGTQSCKYERGELVIYGKYAGIPHTFEGVEYTILQQEEILGKVIETPFDQPDGFAS